MHLNKKMQRAEDRLQLPALSLAKETRRSTHLYTTSLGLSGQPLPSEARSVFAIGF